MRLKVTTSFDAVVGGFSISLAKTWKDSRYHLRNSISLWNYLCVESNIPRLLSLRSSDSQSLRPFAPAGPQNA